MDQQRSTVLLRKPVPPKIIKRLLATGGGGGGGSESDRKRGQNLFALHPLFHGCLFADDMYTLKLIRTFLTSGFS